LLGNKRKVRIGSLRMERAEKKMKTLVALCAVIGAAFFLGSCADQGTHATANNTQASHGLIYPGSVAPVYGGPAPGPVRQRTEP